MVYNSSETVGYTELIAEESGARGQGSFFIFSIAEVFLTKYITGKKLIVRSHVRVTEVGQTVFFKFSLEFSATFWSLRCTHHTIASSRFFIFSKHKHLYPFLGDFNGTFKKTPSPRQYCSYHVLEYIKNRKQTSLYVFEKYKNVIIMSFLRWL